MGSFPNNRMIIAVGKKITKNKSPRIIRVLTQPRTCPIIIHPLYVRRSVVGAKIAHNHKTPPTTQGQGGMVFHPATQGFQMGKSNHQGNSKPNKQMTIAPVVNPNFLRSREFSSGMINCLLSLVQTPASRNHLSPVWVDPTYRASSFPTPDNPFQYA